MAADKKTEEAQEIDDFDPHVNIWQTLLRECTEKTASSGASRADTGGTNVLPSTLVVLGDKSCGKSALLGKFNNLVTVPDTPEYILDYSYINVKNKFIQDKHETLSRMSVWTLDEPSHSDVLPELCGNPSHLAYVICLDLSKPHDILNQLEKWLKVMQDANDKIMSKIEGFDAAVMRKNISKYVQHFVDVSKKSEEDESASGEEKTEEAESRRGPLSLSAAGAHTEAQLTQEQLDDQQELEAAEAKAAEESMSFDEGIPVKNLGVPIFIVGHKGDFFEKGLEKLQAQDQFEFVAKRLRETCLDFGASLIYTSAVGEGTNIEELQDLINHRLFGYPLTHPARVVTTVEEFGLFVPAGFDNTELIEAVPDKKWKQNTKFEEVFPQPDAQKEKKTDGIVAAMENNDFYNHLKEQLEQGHASPAPGGSSSTSRPKASQQKAVKTFFKSLLSGGGSGGSRDQAKEAIDGYKK